MSRFWVCVCFCNWNLLACIRDVHLQLPSFTDWIRSAAQKEWFLRGILCCFSEIWRLFPIPNSQPLMSDNECWRRHKENFWCKIRGNSETQGHLIVRIYLINKLHFWCILIMLYFAVVWNSWQLKAKLSLSQKHLKLNWFEEQLCMILNCKSFKSLTRTKGQMHSLCKLVLPSWC